MPSIQLSLSLDTEFKSEVDKVFADIGLTTTDAIRMFLRQAVLLKGLPLDTNASSMVMKKYPRLELSDEGFENLAKALERSNHQQFEKLMREHDEFAQKHSISGLV